MGGLLSGCEEKYTEALWCCIVVGGDGTVVGMAWSGPDVLALQRWTRCLVVPSPVVGKPVVVKTTGLSLP